MPESANPQEIAKLKQQARPKLSQGKTQARCGVLLTLYHTPPGEQMVSVEHAASVLLDGDEEAFTRSLSLSDGWHAVDLAWADDPYMMAIINKGDEMVYWRLAAGPAAIIHPNTPTLLSPGGNQIQLKGPGRVKIMAVPRGE